LVGVFLIRGGTKMPEYLRINDIAKIMRTTPDAIRFYEKKNIIKPERCSDNKYRNFILGDIRKLYDCKMLQNLHFSISDIANILGNITVDKFEDMLDQKEEELKKTIEIQEMALARIKEIKSASKKILRDKNNFFIQESPHLLIYSYANNNKFDMISVNNQYYKIIMNYHNLFYCTVIIPLKNIMNTDIKNKSKFGFSIDIEIANKFDIPNKSPIQEFKPCKCAYTVVEATSVISYEALEPMYSWIKKHDFKPIGDLLCRVMKVVFDKGEPHRFYEVWCPIE
jgi:DNA-binding transcriptional MerR regulator